MATGRRKFDDVLEPGESRRRRGVSGARFGNYALVSARNGLPLSMSPTATEPANLGLVHLVDGDVAADPQYSQDVANDAPGSWVLTMHARVTRAEPAPGYGGPRCIAPAVARIQFNSGGIEREVWVDACDSTIVLPSTAIYVDVGYSQTVGVPMLEGSPLVAPWEELEVRGAIHRGNGETYATRSYYVFQPSLTYLRIPPYAKAWCYLPFTAVTPEVVLAGGVGQANFWSAEPALGGQMLEYVPPDLFSQNARMHCWRPLHPAAERMYLSLAEDEGEIAYPGTLIFKVVV